MRSSRLLFVNGFVLLSALATAQQPPQAFSYQAVARNSSGHAIVGFATSARFALHQDSPTGLVVYEEEHAITTNDQGLFTVEVGKGTPLSGVVASFGEVEFGLMRVFLEVSLDLDNTGVFTSMGAQELLSVPYALHAGSSSNVPNGTEVGQIMHWDGGAWVADSGLYVYQKRFGIGITEPEAPLSIQAEPTGKLFSVTGEPTPVGESRDQYRLSIAAQNTDSSGLSFEQDTTGGSVSRLFIQSSTGNVGIGTQDPPAPLALVSRSVLKQYFQSGDHPSQSQFGFTLTDTTGFGIEQGIPGSMTSRLFIQSSSGNVGIGNTDPGAPLSVKNRADLYEEFKNGDIPNENDFVISTGGNTGLSFDQDTTGGYASRLSINSSTGHVGIGTNDPPAPLSIETRETLKTYFETGDVPTQDQFAISTGATGLDIGQGAPDALQSRLFIQASSGFVGLGTTHPGTEAAHRILRAERYEWAPDPQYGQHAQ